jgi:acetyl-CoA acetyltransferase
VPLRWCWQPATWRGSCASGRPGSPASTTASSPSLSGCATSRSLDLAELYAPFTHQELILRDALGLGDDVAVNPSGGVLAGHVMMAAGLTRIGEAATRITQGQAERAVAHATSGPCLQQNLVCVLEGK